MNTSYQMEYTQTPPWNTSGSPGMNRLSIAGCNPHQAPTQSQTQQLQMTGTTRDMTPMLPPDLPPHNSNTHRFLNPNQLSHPEALPQQLRWQGNDSVRASAGDVMTYQPSPRRTRGNSRRSEQKTSRGLERTSPPTTVRSKSNLQQLASHPGQANALTPEAMLPEESTHWKAAKYKVNSKKALDKKLKATNRDPNCTFKEVGEGLNVSCQAGLYELLRRASCQYYSKFKTAGLTSQAFVQTDLDAAIVQVTFKVKTYGGQASYSLDLYHTNSTVRLSGRHQQKFIDNDWPRITRIIQEMNEVRPMTDPEMLNYNIQKCLENILANSAAKPANQPVSRNNKSTRGGTTTPEILPSGTTNTTVDDNTTLPSYASSADLPLRALPELTTSIIPVISPHENTDASTHSNTVISGQVNVIPHIQAEKPQLGMGQSTGNNSMATTEAHRSEEMTSSPIASGHQRTGSSMGHEVAQEPDISLLTTGREELTPPPQAQPGTRQVRQTHDTSNAEPSVAWQRDERHIPPCRSCHFMRASMQALEEETKMLQGKVRNQERALQQREKDLSIKAAQYTSSKTHITALENQVKQLQETISLLRDRLAGPEYTMPATNRLTPQDQGQNPRDNLMDSRIKAVENHITELRMSQLEMKVEAMKRDRMQDRKENPLATGPQQYNLRHTPFPIPSPLSGYHLPQNPMGGTHFYAGHNLFRQANHPNYQHAPAYQQNSGCQSKDTSPSNNKGPFQVHDPHPQMYNRRAEDRPQAGAPEHRGTNWGDGRTEAEQSWEKACSSDRGRAERANWRRREEAPSTGERNRNGKDTNENHHSHRKNTGHRAHLEDIMRMADRPQADVNSQGLRDSRQPTPAPREDE